MHFYKLLVKSTFAIHTNYCICFKALTVHIIRVIRGLVVLRFRKTRGEVKLPDIIPHKLCLEIPRPSFDLHIVCHHISKRVSVYWCIINVLAIVAHFSNVDFFFEIIWKSITKLYYLFI